MNYSWSERYWDNVWGYSIVTAHNATVLDWTLINSANDHVLDRMTLTQRAGNVWPLNVDSAGSSNGGGSQTGWAKLGKDSQIAILTIGIGASIIAFAVWYRFVFFPWVIKLVADDPEAARLKRKDRRFEIEMSRM
jgi:hypothetical protein